MSRHRNRNEQHDAHVTQDLANFLGLTHAAAAAEVATAEAEAVAALVELSNEFRQQLAAWREELAKFRAQATPIVDAAADAPAPVELAAGDSASAGDAAQAAANPSPQPAVAPAPPEPATAAVIAVGDPTAKA